jgi:tetratricopeptide (TPR) repeat protein
MQNNTYTWLGVGILIALILLGGIFLWHPHTAIAPTQTSVSTTTTDLGNGITAVTTGGGTVSISTSSPSSSTIVAPSLQRPMTFSASLSSDQVASLRADEQTSIAALTKDPSQSSYWFQLAIDYKSAGDYAGAIAIWNYLTEVAPASYIAYNDLGDLYLNFDKDYSKALTNYLKVVSLQPTDIDAYNNLYILYRYDMNDITAAKAIVAQGLKANPNNPQLESLEAQS